jgi:hypothetical protein
VDSIPCFSGAAPMNLQRLKHILATHTHTNTHLLALSTMDDVVLPVIDDIPFEGWSSWWQVEEDLWTEAAALRRDLIEAEEWHSGWPTALRRRHAQLRRRQWQQLLVEEARMRREWWQLLVQWSGVRWGGVLGHGSDW